MAAKKKLPPMPPGALSINSFCEAHEISRSYYYVLRKRKIGPKEIRLGRRVLISAKAAAVWRDGHEK